jgi:hypothetical protein
MRVEAELDNRQAKSLHKKIEICFPLPNGSARSKVR